MPIGTITVFRRAKTKLGAGVINLATHAFKAVLLGTAQAITDDFAGASTDCRYADLTAEMTTGGNYTLGGLALAAITWARQGATVVFDASDSLWADLNKAGIKYLALYDDTAANKDLLLFFDFDTTSGATTFTSPGTDLRIVWPPVGIVDLT